MIYIDVRIGIFEGRIDRFIAETEPCKEFSTLLWLII